MLRKLPDTLFPLCQRPALIDLAEILTNRKNADENVLKALQILIYFIPETLKHCLKQLLAHLGHILEQVDVNKMGIENIAILFAATIFPVRKEMDSMDEMKKDIEQMSKLFPILLERAEELFSLPDEVIDTLESSLEKQISENNCSRCSTVCFRKLI